MSKNIDDIFESAKKDPELFSQIDINNILASAENEKNDYLENRTLNDIHKAVFENIQDLSLSKEATKFLCDKLIGYRYVDEIHELFKGRHIRWIRHSDERCKLTTGGIVVDIKFLEEGIHILCKNNRNHFIQYKFDECLTFQKLSTEEQLLLMAYEEAQK